MKSFSNTPLALCAALILCLATACSDSSNRPRSPDNPYQPIPAATVEAAPDIGNIALIGTSFPLEDVGYRQREYFISGTASAFSNLSPLGDDGLWEVEAGETAEYRTRVVVYRPQHPVNFSGRVFVEWLNVSAGFDTSPSWTTGHTEIIRAGHAWVGVSAQYVGIEGSPGSLLPLHLKEANPERYASLVHPGDSFSYDMFSQVAGALRSPGDTDLLDGLDPEHLLAFGESQSAMYLVNYINALQPFYNPFDGYMVHSRGGYGIPLAQSPQEAIPVPSGTRIRTDLNVPVMNFQTETDLFLLDAIGSRQRDSEGFRLWEAAGTAHADYYTTVAGATDTGEGAQFALVVEESSIQGYINCDLPMNAGPHAWLFNSALDKLVSWAVHGTAPPTAERLQLNDQQSAFVYDNDGNVRGGVRSPYVDAPVAILSGEGQTGEGFCRLFGTTELFDAATMATLYVDKAGYVQAVTNAAEKAVSAGFLLQADADRIVAAAPLQWDSQVP